MAKPQTSTRIRVMLHGSTVATIYCHSSVASTPTVKKHLIRLEHNTLVPKRNSSTDLRTALVAIAQAEPQLFTKTSLFLLSTVTNTNTNTNTN